jgi:phosphatidylserine/phosphatidylglycerophosphate/cardiolipin synthase-like enzyme
MGESTKLVRVRTAPICRGDNEVMGERLYDSPLAARFAKGSGVSSELQPSPVTRASYPPREGNQVRVLIDGDEAFRRISDAVANARRSVWITVSFTQIDVVLPGCGEPFLDLVSRVALAGVDVRLLFWWSEYAGIGSFRGDPEELERLHALGCCAKMRWDAVHRGCHHQKSYVIDGARAFVGGINLTHEAMSSRAHDRHDFHDLFTELDGPIVADVAHNFAQRWNQATVTCERSHAFPSLVDAADVEDAIAARQPAGTTPLQLVRTLPRDLYRGRAGWSPNERFDLTHGEDSVRTAVLDAIDGARETLYIENQFIMDPDTIDALCAAAARGVEVICVVPLEPDPNLLLYPEDHMLLTRAALTGLAREKSAAMFGLVHEHDTQRAIYVHSKLLIADDRLLQIGSANLWPPSYTRDTELNVIAWDARLAADTRRRLWREHLLGSEANGLEDWRRLARESQAARQATERPLTRLVEIDPAAYYVFADGLVAPWRSARESA